MKKSVSINLSFIKLLNLMVLFIGFSYNLQAQCPTVTNTTQTFCDTQFPKVSNLTATDMGAGVAWFTAISGGTALASNTNLTSGDYWADNALGNCGTRTHVAVIIYTKPTGDNIQKVCILENSTATISN